MTRWLAIVGLVAWASPAYATPQLAGRTSLPDGTVRFKSGSAELTTESVETLRRLADLLRNRPELDPVLLVGHADDRGAEATNVALSKRRADSVREHLVRLGIARARLRTEGAGSVDPLVEGSTDDARQINRRVEVWVTPQGAVARVAKVERKVLSKEAAAPAWRDAKVDMQLRRLAQVRTMKESSSEIRFERDDHIALGPEALVVIFGSPKKTERTRRSVQDIEVRRGSIFASLAEREGRSLDVETGAGRIDVASKKARIDVRPKQAEKRRASTVSVFSGRSSVSNVGKSVVVPEGYGTRVEEGRVPEPPRPLPPAPNWTVVTPVEAFVGDAVELAWSNAPGVTGAEVQVGLQGDAEVARPVVLREAEGTRERMTFERAGIHYVRLAGIDERGVRGAPSVMRRIVVLPKPRGRALAFGAPLRVEVGVPQTITMDAPRGTTLRFGAQTSSRAVALDRFRPGLERVAYALTSTAGDIATGSLDLEVAAVEVAPSFGDGELRWRVTARGRGVEGLAFVVREVPAARRELRIPLGTTSTLAACSCGVEGAAAIDEGSGHYRFDGAFAARPTETIVRVVEPRGPLGFEIVLPPTIAATKEAPESKRDGFFGGGGAGASITHGTAYPLVYVEGGARWQLGEAVDVDLSAAGVWTTHGGPDLVHVFPLLARAAIAYVFGASRLFAGAGGGVRFASPSDTGPAFDLFAGGAFAVLDHGEVRLEAHYFGLGTIEGDDFDAFTLTVGYRHGTWRW